MSAIEYNTQRTNPCGITWQTHTQQERAGGAGGSPCANAPPALEGHGMRCQLRRQACAVAQAVPDAAELPLLAATPGQHTASPRQGHAVVRACEGQHVGSVRRTADS